MPTLRAEALEVREVPALIFGITSPNRLIRFDSARPDIILADTAVTGILGGQVIQSLDFSPHTNELFAVAQQGSSIGVYVINPDTAAATPRSPNPFLTLNLPTGTQSTDFDPVSGQLRMVSADEDHIRVGIEGVPTARSEASINHKTDLAFAPGDPNAGVNPNIVSLANRNNVAGRTTSTVFGLDSVLNSLVRLGGIGSTPEAQDAGLLSTVGLTGVDFGPIVGFDVADGTPPSAFATLVPSGATRSALYLINTDTGAATLIGDVGTGSIGFVRDIAVALVGSVRFDTDSLVVDEGAGTAQVIIRRTLPSLRPTTVDITLLGTGTATAGMDFIAPARSVTFAAGEATKALTITLIDDSDVEPGETIHLALGDITNNATTAAPKEITVTIQGKDSPPPKTRLVVGGATDGSALVFTPNSSGAFLESPSATLSPFGAIAASVRTAAADVNGDGTEDAVLVTGPGVPLRLAVLSGTDGAVLVAPFDPFGGDFTGGGFVSAADLDGDGRAEFVVTPDEGGGPRVSIFSRNADGSTTVRANFLGIDDAAFRGGARAALGDVNGDDIPDVVVAAGFGGGPRTAIFTGQSVLAGSPARLVNDFFAFPGSDAVTLRNGVFVAAGDVNGDGFDDLIFGGGPGGAPRVFILSGATVSAGDVAGAQATPVANFFVAGNSNDRGGARVAATFADADGRADVAVGSGAGSPARVRAYLGKDFNGGGEPGTFQDITVFGGAALPGGVFVG